jgi:mycothione reductase
MKMYDLVIIGSGVGLTFINPALQMGWKTALVEDTKLGGTCLTRGCIPSKVLIYPADLIRETEHAKSVGLDFKLQKYDWKLIGDRMWSQINESEEIEHGIKQAKSAGLDFYKGKAEFTDKYTLHVRLNDTGDFTEEFKAKRIIIAAGCRTAIPPIKGIENVKYVTNETFFGPDFPKEKPWKSMILIGGGVIAAEFAHFFSAFGTEVTIVEMLNRLVSTEEPEISALLEQNFRDRMKIYLNHKAVEVREEGGEKVLTIEDQRTKRTREIKAEVLFLAAGRQPNTDILKVQKAGIETDSRGWIKTNSLLQTNMPNVWALGDINGKYQFRHKANYEADILSRNLFGGEKVFADYSATPWAIFTYPQIGHVGLTQKEAIEKGYKIYVAVNHYSSVAKGFAMGIEANSKEDGFVKLIINEDYRILGAHVIGPEASVLVQPFVYLMNSGYTCQRKAVDSGKGPISMEQLKMKNACPDAGSFMPIYHSMVIHPSLNEVTGWAIGKLRPINIPMHDSHVHSHDDEQGDHEAHTHEHSDHHH